MGGVERKHPFSPLTVFLVRNWPGICQLSETHPRAPLLREETQSISEGWERAASSNSPGELSPSVGTGSQERMEAGGGKPEETRY